MSQNPPPDYVELSPWRRVVHIVILVTLAWCVFHIANKIDEAEKAQQTQEWSNEDA